ncbi:MAG: CotH kinase family protein, partial [Alistipes sp.]|nr:CotH kinase family protein [Alistipes sp.]
KEWINVTENVLEVSYNEGTAYRKANILIKDKKSGENYEVALTQKGAPANNVVMGLDELIIDGYKCPTDSRTSAKDFMYSVDMDETDKTKGVKIEFFGEGVQWITIGNSNTKYYSGDIITLDKLKAGSTLRLYAQGTSTTKKGSHVLMVTGLPIVEINTEQPIKDEPKVDCTIKLYDPKARTDDGDRKNLKYFESKAGIEYRGAGAMRYVKKPYNFKLYDKAGEKREAELLNIRNDNSWILDAMFLDIAHMRTRVCFDIWNEFNKPYYVNEKPKAMSGTRGHHVEAFINGEYFGLFTLTDRIDRKQYQIEQQGGYIYKAKGWTDACRLRGCPAVSNSSYYWSAADIEQEYPDADDGMQPNFNYLADMINFVGSSSKEDFSAKFEEHFDMNSIVDGFIYLNMIVAHDNIGRNTFWILRDVKESKKFIHGLWDLDGTLGRTWNRFTENPSQGWVSSGFRIYERIISENPANIHQKIYDRWLEIKDAALAPENFNQKVDYYVKQQVASGARDREVSRWQSIDMNDQRNWG